MQAGCAVETDARPSPSRMPCISDAALQFMGEGRFAALTCDGSCERLSVCDRAGQSRVAQGSAKPAPRHAKRFTALPSGPAAARKIARLARNAPVLRQPASVSKRTGGVCLKGQAQACSRAAKPNITAHTKCRFACASRPLAGREAVCVGWAEPQQPIETA